MIKKSLLSLLLAASMPATVTGTGSESAQVSQVIENDENNSISFLQSDSNAEPFMNSDEDFQLEVADINFFSGTELKFGTTLIDRVIRSYFMRPGRIKWVQFLDSGVTGKHKQVFSNLKWKHFETQHFNIFTYDRKLNKKFMPFLEETFDEYEKRTGQIFDNKLDIWLFHNRRDMGQDMRLPGIVPEGLGGITFTEKSEKFRIISLWEGVESEWRHVYRHEIDHRFFIEKLVNSEKVSNLPPLWYIEGHAEHFSKKWDARKEMMLRDSWHNNFFIPVNMLNFVPHPFALYLEGNFILNVIADKFGEEALRRIDDNTEKTGDFEKNIRMSLGLSMENLESLVFREAAKRCSARQGIEDESINLGPGRMLAANENFIVYGSYGSLHDRLMIGKIGFGPEGHAEIEWKELDRDRVPESDSLHYFSRGADIKNNLIAYVVQDNGHDAIRIKRAEFNKNKKGEICGENCESERINVKDVATAKFRNIKTIRSPVFIDDENLAFIGDKGDFLNVFVYNIHSRQAKQITYDENAYLQMDYSESLEKLVVAREDELTDNPNRCDTNVNLYFLDIKTGKLEKLPDTGGDEKDPAFSPDGKRVLFTGDESGTYTLYIYDIEKNEIEKVGDAKVGAFSGRWIDNKAIAFNTTKRLMPQMLIHKVPSTEELMVTNTRGFENPDDLANSRLERHPEDHERDKEYASNNPNKIFGHLSTTESRPEIEWNGSSYTITEAIPTDKGLILKGNIKNAPRKETEKAFILKSGRIISEDAETKSLENLIKEDSNLELDLMFLRKHHTIGEPKVLGDGRYIAAVVNTKLDSIDAGQEDGGKNIIRMLIYDRMSRRRFWIDRPSESVHDEEDAQLLQGNILMLSRIEKGWSSCMRYNTFYNLEKFAPERVFSDLIVGDEALRETLSLSFITPDKRYIVAERQISKDVEWSVLDKNFKELYAYDLLNKKTIKINGLILDEDLEKKVSGNRVVYHDKERGTYYVVDVNRGIAHHIILSKPEHKEITDFAVTENGDITVSFFDRMQKRTSVYSGKLDSEKIEQKITLEKKIDKMCGAEKFHVIGDITLFAETCSALEGKIVRHMAFSNGKIYDSAKIKKMAVSKDEKNIIFSDDNNIYIFNSDNSSLRTIENTKGFDIDGNTLYYSALSGDDFDIFSIDLKSGETKIIKQTQLNEVFPKVSDGKVINKVFFRKTYHAPKKGKLPEEINPNEKSLEKKFKINIFDRVSGTGLLGWSGGSYVLIDGIVMCQDQLKENYLVADATFFGKNLIYADLVYGNSKKGVEVDLYGHYVWGDLNSGVSIAKKIPFSRYTALRLTGGYEFAQSSMKIDYTGDAHLLKVGIGLGYDSSQYGFHGPRDGQKAFAIATAGLNLLTGNLANVDLNAGVRNYWAIGSMLSIATRAEFGGSIGEMPTLYLMGGSMTLRGIPLNSEWGNIYALGSLELRADIIDVAGLIFKDPITPASIFTYFPEVELGIYFDTGDAWYYNPAFHPARKNSTFDWKYNTGIFLQIPTLYGMEFQFAFPIYGNDNREKFNFWIGGRW